MQNSNLPTVLVVGAAGGIGLETVKQLISKARVIGIVLNEEQAQLAQEAGVSSTFTCDVSDTQAVENTLTAINTDIAERDLTAVIYCAAIQPAVATELVTREVMEKVFSINVFGTLQIVQGILPALRKSKGRLVLFSSMAGKVSSPMLGPYAASKFAMEALADALRRELKDSDIDISLIEPGGVKTALAFSQPTLVSEGLSQLSDEDRLRYEPLYNGYGETTSKALQNASTPEYVASVAVKAATSSSRPKIRYAVGNDAKFIILLAKILPTRWVDRLLMNMFFKK